MDVLHLPDLEVFGDISYAVTNSHQFRRIAPATAVRFRAYIEPPLIRAFRLAKIDGRPCAQPHFTVA
ncbi:hypothetical protein PF003_g24041 [Phytophthora fragariae]|nr:hypothetical protein PF003_g24041 [Phytophthora fragariae]